MKLFIYKILIFCSISLIALAVTNYIADKGLRKSNYWMYEDWNEIYNTNIEANTVIIGSSRSWRHLSPEILDSITGLKSYNLGLDGSDLDMQIVKYKVYSNIHPKPKIIIQMLDINTLWTSGQLPYPNQFIPYFNDSVLYSGIMRYNYFSKIQVKLPLLTKYFGSGNIVMYGFKEFAGISKIPKSKMNGYCGNNKSWDNSFDIFKKNNSKGYIVGIDTIALNKFDKFLRAQQNENIKVVLLFSPEYIECQHIEENRKAVIDTFFYFAHKYNIPFINYSDSSLSYQKKYFYNSQHLNKKGAELFSKSVAKTITTFL